MPLIQLPSSIRSGSETIRTGAETIQVGTSTIQPGPAQQVIVRTNTCLNYGLDTVSGVLNFLYCTFIRFIIPMLIALAITAFIWGVTQTLLNPSNEEARKKGKSFMLWGLVSLFVIATVWGLVEILTSTFGLNAFVPPLSQ